MKKQIVVILVIVFCLLQQGCVVLSFYPLFTPEDLISNSKIEGKWFEETMGTWEIQKLTDTELFKQSKYTQEELKKHKKTYLLSIYTDENQEISSVFSLHLLKIGGATYADFYPVEWSFDTDNLLSSNLVAAHSFAKIKIGESLELKWFDSDWLETLIKQNKIRIRHEKNEQNILLTAKPKELQKFVLKYGNHKEAYDDKSKFRKVK